MRTALFFSGGKDAFHCLTERPAITHLLTTYDETTQRLPIQGIRLSVIRAQARAIGLPLVEIPLPPSAPNPAYVSAVRAAIAGHRLSTLVFGDLLLEDVRAFRERALGDLAVQLEFPLWGRHTGRLAHEMIASGLRARICSIAPGAIEPALLGRAFDDAFLAALPDTVDPCGERGEFHTLVTGARDMPAIQVGPCGHLESMGYQVLDYDLAP